MATRGHLIRALIPACLALGACASGDSIGRHQAGDVSRLSLKLAAGSASEATAAAAGQDATALAKQTQNPVADLISLPLQLNSNFKAGLREKTQTVFNIQPVIPEHLDEDWNWIHRTIIPVIGQPSFAPGSGGTTGLGDIIYQGFLSPAHPEGAIWGVGPAITAPTSNDDRLGNHEWAAGPAFVVLTMDGPWVYGGLVNHQWSLESTSRTNLTTLQPFVNYNFEGGWYLTSAPILTANWDADHGSNVWTVPVGGGGGRLFRVGDQAMNLSLQAFTNVERPERAPRWSTRLQLSLLFPKDPPAAAQGR